MKTIKYGLTGNIHCIDEGCNDWSAFENFRKKDDIKLDILIKQFSAKDNGIRRMKKVFLDNQIIENKYAHIPNLYLAESLDKNQTQILTGKLKEKEEFELITKIKEIGDSFILPKEILFSNIGIPFQIQDDVYAKVKSSHNNFKSIEFPKEFNKETTENFLIYIAQLYNWETNENISIKQISYYSLLMRHWVNGYPLARIINESISYYHNESKDIYLDRGSKELFNIKSKEHINVLINNIIYDLENTITYTFEKYFRNYYLIIKELLPSDKKIINWATYIEYGSQNDLIIELQRLGLSRQSSNSIFEKFPSLINYIDGVLKIDIVQIMNCFLESELEYQELKKILGNN